MTIEVDRETERLIERELKAGHVPNAQTLINRAVRAYIHSHPGRELGESICVEDLQSRGELGLDGLYEAERRILYDRDTPERRRERERAVDSIRKLRKGVTLGPDLKLKDLVNAGRRM